MKTNTLLLAVLVIATLTVVACRSKKPQATSSQPVIITHNPTATDTPKSTQHASHLPTPLPKQWSAKDQYEQAFTELKHMLEEKVTPDFERAVFISENPYHQGKFAYADFQYNIIQYTNFIKRIIKANDNSDTMNFDVGVNEFGRFSLRDLRYLPEQKKELYRKALSNWAVFKFITDTVIINYVSDSAISVAYHVPYAYAATDPFGMKDWTNSQVLGLITSKQQKGNCFALTALYKILSDRLQADAKICTAPQHIYIQHQNPQGQYYNVELATAGHPADGIIQTLTHTPSDAIRSGIALRDYTTKQSIGLCLVNLAKSYEHQFNTKGDEFMLRCAALALRYDSLNLNALLLKAQILDARVTHYANTHHINSMHQLSRDSAIAPEVVALEKHLARLAALGYRQMPVDMQQLIVNPLQYDPNKWNHQTRNPRPFTTIKVQDPKDEEYWTLTKGMFQEVFEPREQETYGHYTINTQTKRLVAMDTTTVSGFIIDPVAFAYDFGARMYDARIGHFVSVDPHASRYPGISPYNFAYNSPLVFNDPDGKDGRVSITGNTITLETTVHCYGPDAAAFIAANKGYSSSGTVKIEGKTYIVKINVTYVLNEQLNTAAAGMNMSANQTQPEASNFAKQGVKEGDNMMYVDKNFKMAKVDAGGMTTQGGSNARLSKFQSAANETMNMLGFSDRYGEDEFGTPWPDGEKFMSDFASNNPNNDPRTMNPVHLYDAAKFANTLTSIAKKTSLAYKNMLIEDFGTGKTHTPEDPKVVEEKSKAVSDQTTINK